MRFTLEQLQNHPKRDELLGLKPHQKATDAQLCAAYAQTASIWKTAAQFNMAGQSVWERLARLGVIDSNHFTPDVERSIENFYNRGFKKGELNAFCAQHRLLKTSVARWARRQGLTQKQRTCSEDTVKQMTARAVKQAATWQAQGTHPKGFQGKTHTDATKEQISLASKKSASNRSSDDESKRISKMLHTKLEKGCLVTPRKCSWKQGWCTVGARRVFLRSRWEVNYARYLEFRQKLGEILSWDYEAETFWFKGIKRGTTNYTPDFKITFTDGHIEWHEVKGWMDARSATKIKRMKKYHPTVALVVIDKHWFRQHKALSKTVPGWISCRF